MLLLAGSGGGVFEPGRPLLTGMAVEGVVLADFDRDGKRDLGAYSQSQNSILILRVAGDGTFGARLRLSTLEAPRLHVQGAGLIAADLNQDGFLDLAAEQDTSIAVFFGKGDGTFQSCRQLLAGDVVTAVVAADFNGDGLPDLATANFSSDDVSVLLATGQGAFRAPADTSTGDRATSMTAADLNRDGKMDLAVTTQSGVMILLGNGDGTFHRAWSFSEDYEPVTIAAADLNGDGAPDLAVGNYYGGVIHILLEYGDGSFHFSGLLGSLGDLAHVVLADLNGDSKPDLVAASHSSGTALVALATGSGGFAGPAHFGAPNFAFLRTGDADADGKPGRRSRRRV